MNNLFQQAGLIEDAYTGNLDGLKQRVEKAGVSNELLAAFVLQGELAKKEAAQRNAAMQQQGDPRTVTQQMQLALDAKSGPSEGDVVERTGIAGQQMAQNAQMPQGPQGPQGGGGIASQAGPVKLAGGGIVAFDNGSDGKGPVEAEETVSYAELASELGTEALEWAKENPVDAAILGISFVPIVGPALGAVGRGGLGAFRIGKKGYDMLKANPTAQSLATKAKDLAVGAVTKPAMKSKQLTRGNTEQPLGDAAKSLGLTDDAVQAVTARGRVYDPVKGLGIAGAAVTAKNLLSDDEEEEIEETGIAGQPASTATKPGPSGGLTGALDPNADLASMMPSQPNQPGVGVLRDGSLEDLAKPPAPTSATGDPYLDALLKRTAEPRPAYEPPERSAELTGILSKLESTQRDPDAEARRIRDLYREEESRGINTSRLQELRSKYDKQEEQLSDPFNRFIGMASKQGKEGIAAAGQEYLAQDAGIRGLEDKYQGERDVIRQEQVTLNNTLGEKAVAAYNKTLDRNSQNDRQLATAFSALNERDQENARNAFEDAVKGDDKLDGLLIKLSDVRRRAIEDTTMTAGEAATASGQITNSIKSMQEQLQIYQGSYLQKAIPLELYAEYANNPLGLSDDDREKIAKAQSDALLDPEYVKQVAKLKKAIEASEDTRSSLINKAGGEDVPSNNAAAAAINKRLGVI